MDMPHFDSSRALLILEPFLIGGAVVLLGSLRRYLFGRTPRRKNLSYLFLDVLSDTRNAPLPVRAQWKQLIYGYGFLLWLISWLWRMGMINNPVLPLIILGSLLGLTIVVITREQILSLLRKIVLTFESRRTVDPIDTNV